MPSTTSLADGIRALQEKSREGVGGHFKDSSESTDRVSEPVPSGAHAAELGVDHFETEDRKKSPRLSGSAGNQATHGSYASSLSPGELDEVAGPRRVANRKLEVKPEENDEEIDSRTVADAKLAANRARKRRNAASSRQNKKLRIERLKGKLEELEQTEQELLSERSHLKAAIADLKNKSRQNNGLGPPRPQNRAPNHVTTTVAHIDQSPSGLSRAQHSSPLEYPAASTWAVASPPIGRNIYPSPAQERQFHSDVNLSALRFVPGVDSTVGLFHPDVSLNASRYIAPGSDNTTAQLQRLSAVPAATAQLAAVVSILQSARNTEAFSREHVDRETNRQALAIAAIALERQIIQQTILSLASGRGFHN